MVQKNQELRRTHWVTGSPVCSFARTSHSFACSTLLPFALALAVCCAHLFAHSLTLSLSSFWESEWLLSQNDLILSHRSISVSRWRFQLQVPHFFFLSLTQERATAIPSSGIPNTDLHHPHPHQWKTIKRTIRTTSILQFLLRFRRRRHRQWRQRPEVGAEKPRPTIPVALKTHPTGKSLKWRFYSLTTLTQRVSLSNQLQTSSTSTHQNTLRVGLELLNNKTLRFCQLLFFSDRRLRQYQFKSWDSINLNNSNLRFWKIETIVVKNFESNLSISSG